MVKSIEVIKASVVLCLALLMGACAPKKIEPIPQACPGCPLPPPGTVNYVWEEPMVDVVDVPPGLDPDGVFYRPAHQEVVEIRQGRWRYHQAEGSK